MNILEKGVKIFKENVNLLGLWKLIFKELEICLLQGWIGKTKKKNSKKITTKEKS